MPQTVTFTIKADGTVVDGEEADSAAPSTVASVPSFEVANLGAIANNTVAEVKENATAAIATVAETLPTVKVPA
jgi:hypothetical protein